MNAAGEYWDGRGRGETTEAEGSPAGITAVVLAGRPNNGRLRDEPVAWEAMIPVGGRAMAALVAEALAGTPGVNEVRVVGPVELAPQLPPGTVLIPPEATLWDNLRVAAVGAARGSLLLATGDIPLLVAAAVEDFLARCAAMPGDIHYSVVSQDVVQRSYPGARRTYVRLADGVFTGGNLFLVRREALETVIAWGERVYALRKQPLRLGLLLGPLFVWRLVLGHLTMADAEQRAGRLLGLMGRAVITPFPAIGVDVDRPEDLSLIRAIMHNGS